MVLLHALPRPLCFRKDFNVPLREKVWCFGVSFVPVLDDGTSSNSNERSSICHLYTVVHIYGRRFDYTNLN